MNKVIKILSIYLFLIVILNLFLSNNLVSQNTELNYLYNKKTEISKEISRLNYIQHDLSSISNLTLRAEEIGFIKNNSPLLTLDVSSYFSIAYNID